MHVVSMSSLILIIDKLIIEEALLYHLIACCRNKLCKLCWRLFIEINISTFQISYRKKHFRKRSTSFPRIILSTQRFTGKVWKKTPAWLQWLASREGHKQISESLPGKGSAKNSAGISNDVFTQYLVDLPSSPGESPKHYILVVFNGNIEILCCMYYCMFVWESQFFNISVSYLFLILNSMLATLDTILRRGPFCMSQPHLSEAWTR